ncbi:MAG: hypothetical protein HFG68_13655 [Hungatella sp.]|nr:hypothetical protein [Hungatella sp.]
MASIIFYGAGRNACEKFETWISKGLAPVCFADADIKKHHTPFVNDIMILPLMEAIEKYPDYELFCTQSSENLYDIKNFLLSIGIPRDKIKFCETIDTPRHSRFPINYILRFIVFIRAFRMIYQEFYF